MADDSGTGVYAMWAQGGLHVDYSPDGGAHWGPAVEVPDPTTGSMEFDDPDLSAVGNGTFQIAFNSDPGTGIETYLGTYSYQQLLLAPTTLGTKQSSGSVSGASISIPAGTVGESDRAIISGTPRGRRHRHGHLRPVHVRGLCRLQPGDQLGRAGHRGHRRLIPRQSPASLAEGTYYWRAAYSGDPANDPSTSSCGSENLTVGPAATTPATATATSTTVSLTVTCATLPCTVTVTITIPAAGTAFASGHRTSTKKVITLATGRLTISKRGKHTLKLKLTGKGKLLFKKDRQLGTTLLLSTKTKHGTFVSTHALKITRK